MFLFAEMSLLGATQWVHSKLTYLNVIYGRLTSVWRGGAMFVCITQVEAVESIQSVFKCSILTRFDIIRPINMFGWTFQWPKSYFVTLCRDAVVGTGCEKSKNPQIEKKSLTCGQVLDFIHQCAYTICCQWVCLYVYLSTSQSTAEH